MPHSHPSGISEAFRGKKHRSDSASAPTDWGARLAARIPDHLEIRAGRVGLPLIPGEGAEARLSPGTTGFGAAGNLAGLDPIAAPLRSAILGAFEREFLFVVDEFGVRYPRSPFAGRYSPIGANPMRFLGLR